MHIAVTGNHLNYLKKNVVPLVNKFSFNIVTFYLRFNIKKRKRLHWLQFPSFFHVRQNEYLYCYICVFVLNNLQVNNDLYMTRQANAKIHKKIF